MYSGARVVVAQLAVVIVELVAVVLKIEFVLVVAVIVLLQAIVVVVDDADRFVILVGIIKGRVLLIIALIIVVVMHCDPGASTNERLSYYGQNTLIVK